MIGEFVILLIIFYFFYHMFWKRRGFPPGPIPLPIIGNLLSLYPAESMHETFYKWGKKYGPLYTIWFGEIPVITMADYETILETFQKEGDTYAGRMFSPSLTELMRGGYYGIIFTEGDIWRDQRRFALHVFRDFGLGKNVMQEKILLEVSSLISSLKKAIGNEEENGINISSYLDVSIGSIINSLLFGYRFEGKKLDEFRRIKYLVNKLNLIMAHPVSILMWKNTEIFKYLPYAKNIHSRICYRSEKIFDFFQKQVDEHRQNIDLNSEPTDYVDAYLREKAKKDNENSAHYYTMQQLLNMCFDLWLAGQESTTSSLSWGIIYLIHDQKVQENLHKELDTVIGSDRLIVMEDKNNLPYTNAIVNEIQRLSNIVFIIAYHTTTKDTVYRGHRIEKGTAVMPMLSSVLYDEKIFPDPHQFKPERFFDKDGNLRKVDEFIPFSVGRRQCLGESLARMELFLFVANIFNQFKISTVNGQYPSLERKPGVTITPYPFVCTLEKRF